MFEQIPEDQVEGKRLGRHIEHDPRSLNYPAVRKVVPLRKVSWRRYGLVFDQGNLGSCTGNAIAGTINTKPVHKPARKMLVEADAVSIYEAATIIDGVPGSYPPDDTGSSALAVCKVAQSRGLITSYQWAFGIEQALQALMSGPVITGVYWYSGFDHPDSQGVVQLSGDVRGGHEFELVGYDPVTDLVEAINSWGASWGKNGRFYFTSKTLAELLSQQGDVAVPLR